MKPETLKTWRQAEGWSQEKLGDFLGVDRKTVNRWERGRHPISATAKKLLERVMEEAQGEAAS